MSKTEFTTPDEYLKLELTREFDAPRDLVFRAFTEPELFAQWIGPRYLTNEVVEMDVRAGGYWRFVQTAPDGGQHAFHGWFHNEPTPDQIVQTWEYEGAPGEVLLNTMSLEERDGRTLLRASTIHPTTAAFEAMAGAGAKGGATEGYERLDELLVRLGTSVGS